MQETRSLVLPVAALISSAFMLFAVRRRAFTIQHSSLLSTDTSLNSHVNVVGSASSDTDHHLETISTQAMPSIFHIIAHRFYSVITWPFRTIHSIYANLTESIHNTADRYARVRTAAQKVRASIDEFNHELAQARQSLPSRDNVFRAFGYFSAILVVIIYRHRIWGFASNVANLTNHFSQGLRTELSSPPSRGVLFQYPNAAITPQVVERAAQVAENFRGISGNPGPIF